MWKERKMRSASGVSTAPNQRYGRIGGIPSGDASGRMWKRSPYAAIHEPKRSTKSRRKTPVTRSWRWRVNTGARSSLLDDRNRTEDRGHLCLNFVDPDVRYARTLGSHAPCLLAGTARRAMMEDHGS